MIEHARVVGDIPAKLAQDALRRIEAGEAQVYDGWCAYGAQLLVMREQLPDGHAFNAWVTANGLDTGRAARGPTRSDAIWLAEHKYEVDTARLSGSLHSTVNHPTNIRQAARAAGFLWAGAKPRKDGTPKASGKIAAAVATPIPVKLAVAPAPAPMSVPPATLQAKHDALVAENANLRFALTHYQIMRDRWDAREAEHKAELQKALEKQERALTGDGYQLPKKWTRDERFKLILQLCHPDKHAGSSAAQVATSWLNTMRKSK